MNRAEAYDLLNEYVKDRGLQRHMLAVEAALRAYARKYEADEEMWGMTGLLHDFDYERWPNPPDHPLKGSVILRERSCPEEIIYAILSHADYLTQYPRIHLLDKVLYACDELAGLIMATALVRPGGIMGMTASSVKKKLKSKGFAHTINRDDITRGATDLGVDLTDHIQFVIDAIQPMAAELELLHGLPAVDYSE